LEEATLLNFCPHPNNNNKRAYTVQYH